MALAAGVFTGTPTLIDGCGATVAAGALVPNGPAGVTGALGPGSGVGAEPVGTPADGGITIGSVADVAGFAVGAVSGANPLEDGVALDPPLGFDRITLGEALDITIADGLVVT
jgi:hypothetical protein